MPHLAIDASTAAKWQLSEEPEAERARHMLRDYAAAKVTFVAPTIWHYEVANIVNKAVGTRRLSYSRSHHAMKRLRNVVPITSKKPDLTFVSKIP